MHADQQAFGAGDACGSRALPRSERVLGPEKEPDETKVYKAAKHWQGHGDCTALDSTPDILGPGPYNFRGPDSMVAYFRHLLQRCSRDEEAALRRWLERTELSYASICSGTESPHVVLSQFREALGGAAGFIHSFSCELAAEKARHIIKTSGCSRVFVDAHTLIDGVAKDWNAPRSPDGSIGSSNIPRTVDLIIAGFPCTDISTLNIKSASSRHCVERGTHRTGGVYRSILSYAKLSLPYMIVLENVRALDFKSKSQLRSTPHLSLSSSRVPIFHHNHLQPVLLSV